MVRTFKKIAASCIFAGVHLIKAVFFLPRGTCRFSPTCSVYAKEAIESLPVHRAVILIISRILRCHPLCAGGYDPIPKDCTK